MTLCTFLIICLETSNYNRDPTTYSIFNITFEVVSANGPVGLSTGLPDKAYSLSGGFGTASKVLICGVMIRGRHRGLPVSIDKAVMLPSEKLDHREEAD
jgi:Trk-type K+ transport system membrane component